MFKVNLVGALMLLITAIVLAILKLFLPIVVSATVAFVMLLILDLVYRKVVQKGGLFSGEHGGIFVLPTWLFAILMLGITAYKIMEGEI